ncbi:MAG: complex I NDUFA9 subunit family protein [Gammaproteobacteria bacterium]|nr:complex I NDUFA9 subunit family protein [Gammaproteobacteria bacterium]
MLIRKICILGGTGFVGRTLANRLTRDGYELRILTRDRESRRQELILLPTTELVQADVHDPTQLRENFADCDAVINLVGILNERGRDGSGFRKAHVELTQSVIDMCRETGVRRLLQMSALNADAENGPSHYQRTKGEAEKRVLAAESPDLHVTCFRPSVIFGNDDSFFNRFAKLLKIAPVFPLACPKARFAPVYVEDVAEAFTLALTDPDTYGKSYNLCGPHEYTLQQLAEYTAQCAGLRRIIFPLNDFLSRLQAAVFDYVPGKPFSTDNYQSATVDSVCSGSGVFVLILGITPTAVVERWCRAI